MTTAAIAGARRGPSVAYLGVHRGAIELKAFFRERDAVVFTFALPAVLLALLGAMISGVYEGSSVTSAQYLVPSMVAAGVASTTFVNLGISVAADRADGTLKRLRGAPMPAAAYFLGKVIMLLVVTVAEVVVLFGIGVLMFDVTMPTDPSRWLTFAWVFVLGVTGCAFLGIAASSLASSERSAGAVMNLPYIALSLVSGIFYTPISALPESLVTMGSLFPLKWMAQGFRSALLPDTILAQEIVMSWEHGRTAVILGAWCIGGLLLRRLVYRFRSETGLHAEFATDVHGPPLPKALEVVLLRTAQESLTNVRKHARARAVVVRLEHHDGSVVLETQDDGCGRAAPAESGGYGLAAMRGRVEQMSGTITVSSEAGSGTLVRVEVPVR